MTVRQMGGALGVSGGVVWIARWALSPEGTAADLMRWAGLVLILLGLVCIGLTLVKGAVLWLDVIVAIGAPALFWAVYELLRSESGDGFILHGALGVVCVVAGALTYVRDRQYATGSTSHRA